MYSQEKEKKKETKHLLGATYTQDRRKEISQVLYIAVPVYVYDKNREIKMTKCRGFPIYAYLLFRTIAYTAIYTYTSVLARAHTPVTAKIQRDVTCIYILLPSRRARVTKANFETLPLLHNMSILSFFSYSGVSPR